MIRNSEEANKYYQLVNKYIDEYTETHKIGPKNLSKYFNKKNDKLIKFIERNGLKDIKNIQRVIDDVIEDRISIENDTVRKFESFRIFESDEFKFLNLRQCLYKGIEKCDIEHEKIIADYFDTSLGHIDVVDSNKHIFNIEDVTCVIYNSEEINIITQNMKEFFFNEVFNKEIKIESFNIGLNFNIKNFIDEDKFYNYINTILTIEKVTEYIKVILSCDKVEMFNGSVLGINPSHY